MKQNVTLHSIQLKDMFDVINYKQHVNIHAQLFIVVSSNTSHTYSGKVKCVCACGLLQDVLCGVLDMVCAVHFEQCEVHRVVVLCVCVCVYTHTYTTPRLINSDVKITNLLLRIIYYVFLTTVMIVWKSPYVVFKIPGITL
jgi:hypothetical protein